MKQTGRRLPGNQRDRKKLEGDIQVHQQKISKLRDQTLGAKNNDQYKAFQNEIAYAEAEIGKCEDRILSLMEAAEPLDIAVKTADAALKTEQKQVEGEKVRARNRSASDVKELNIHHAERKTVTDQMTPAFYKEYERLRKKTKKPPHCRCHRRALRSVPDVFAAPVLPGPSPGRPHHVLRKLRPHTDVQPGYRYRERCRGFRTDRVIHVTETVAGF